MQRKRRVVVVSSRISLVYVGKRKRQVDREEKRDRKSTQIDKLGGAPPPSVFSQTLGRSGAAWTEIRVIMQEIRGKSSPSVYKVYKGA